MKKVFLRCVLAFFLLLLLFAASFAQSSDTLRTAIRAIGGDEAIKRAASISVVMVGKQDSRAIDQGYFATTPLLVRQQETLIVDESSRRAVMRSEGLNSDCSPTSWRWSILGDDGFTLKIKTGNVSKMSKEQAAAMYENIRWRIPHLALAEMKRREDKFRCEGVRRIEKQSYKTCQFETAAGKTFTVLFSVQTGQLAGYEYNAPTMRGEKLMRYEFKPYIDSGIGLFPSGYRFTIGGEVYRDLDLLGAQTAELESHPWMKTPPEGSFFVYSVSKRPPASTEEVAPGVWIIRNVGGYNAMFARVGDCVAVFDAPASYGSSGGPLPNSETQPDRSAIIIDKIKEVTGKKVCYVIPTHHHNDHFGGIAGFVREGATVVTSPGNAALAREVVQKAGISAIPKIQIVREKLTFGAGSERFDAWLISNDQHAKEMIFIHWPKRKIVYEGDLVDYVPSAWNFLSFVGQKKLQIDRVFSTHSANPHTLKDIQWEDPGN